MLIWEEAVHCLEQNSGNDTDSEGFRIRKKSVALPERFVAIVMMKQDNLQYKRNNI